MKLFRLLSLSLILLSTAAQATSWRLMPVFIHNPDPSGRFDFHRPILERWGDVLETVFGHQSGAFLGYKQASQSIGDAGLVRFAERVDNYMNHDNIVSGAEIIEYLKQTTGHSLEEQIAANTQETYYLALMKKYVFEPAMHIAESKDNPVVTSVEIRMFLGGSIDLLGLQSQGAKVIGSRQREMGVWTHTVWSVPFSVLRPQFVTMLRRMHAYEPLILFVPHSRERNVSEIGILNDQYTAKSEGLQTGPISHFDKGDNPALASGGVDRKDILKE